MTEKKYQVFVSSTYADLIEERQEVMHALLELDCIPSGMELFPAANEDQWSLIKGVIDECDYYLLILAGRYGSTDSDGKSYTEKEYRYALELGKPIISFLHKSPDKIEQGKSEQTDDGKKKLAEFRALTEKKMCKYWDSPSELGSVASRSLINLIKKTPGTGWIRGDSAVSPEAAKEILTLRRNIEELEKKLQAARTQAPPGTENLSQGDEEFEIAYSFKDVDEYGFSSTKYTGRISYSWNELFYEICPLLINEATEPNIRGALNNLLARDLHDFHNSDFKQREITFYSLKDFVIAEHDFQTIKVQLRALGLITQSTKNRSVKDTATYWTLTPYGNEIMVRLRAIKKGDVKTTDEENDASAEDS